MKKTTGSTKNIITELCGLLAAWGVLLPCVFLGQGSYVQIHDQLDGEVLNYIYQARHLFDGDIIPEFMNGMSKAAMIPPAPFGVLFYLILPGFMAYMAMYFMNVTVGYLGTRLLGARLGIRREVAMALGVIFAWMPFYPTYGLTVWGQPLLIYCYLRLLGEEKKGRVFSWLGIALYTLFSSFSLLGFAWIGLGVLAALFLLIKKEPGKSGRTILGVLFMSVLYVLTNLPLFASLLGDGFVTHREEMVLRAAGGLGARFLELSFRGGAYHPVYAAPVLGVLAMVGVLWIVNRKKPEHVGKMVFLCACILFAGLAAAFWTCSSGVNLRLALGGAFTYFQADRVVWILPTLWMLLGGLGLESMLAGAQKPDAGRSMKSILAIGLCCGILLGQGALVFRDSTFNKNIRLLLLKDYTQVTWKSFYMPKVFRQIDDVIGMEKEEMNVVSVGIYPSIALYNGYHCADGYSNNYDLSYKHAFRRIEAEELEKNEEVRTYFDDWGNRLYLVSAEYGFNGMIGRGQIAGFSDLALNLDAMRELNIRYLFAAAPIENAKELGLELLAGSPFSDAECYYEVWVYRIPAL